MVSTQGSRVPDGFKDQMKKLLRAVLINRPVEPNRFIAEYLEAELDRRTLYDLQLGRHIIRRPGKQTVRQAGIRQAGAWVTIGELVGRQAGRWVNRYT